MLDQITIFIPLIITVVGVLLFMFGAHWLLLGRHVELENGSRFHRQLILFGLSVAGIVAIALALPVSDSTRNQVIALIGVMVSGVIAFSSTTIVANFMAGIMMRTTRRFRTGDFIRVGEHFGRVVEKGLFDTEIQTEHRELISLPNAYLITHPVTVIRNSGTIISVSLSLGYNVHYSQIQAALIAAAQKCGLEEPYIQIIELGNYAITYRVSGLLIEVKSILTTRSELSRFVLDSLHDAGIEIVSPVFMNQRQMAEQTRIMPPSMMGETTVESANLEEIVFDKAEKAERQEETKINLETKIEELESRLRGAEGDEKKRISESIELLRAQLAGSDSSASEPVLTGDQKDVVEQSKNEIEADPPP